MIFNLSCLRWTWVVWAVVRKVSSHINQNRTETISLIRTDNLMTCLSDALKDLQEYKKSKSTEKKVCSFPLYHC